MCFIGTCFCVHVSKKTQKNRNGRLMLQEMKGGILSSDADNAKNHINKRRFEFLKYQGGRPHFAWPNSIVKRTEVHVIQEGISSCKS